MPRQSKSLARKKLPGKLQDICPALPCHVSVEAYCCAAFIIGLLKMTKPGKLRNAPLKLLSSVYKRTGPKEQCIDESSETSECSGETSTSGERLRMKSLIDYWKCHPLENVWKETSCTLRYAPHPWCCVTWQLLLALQKVDQLEYAFAMAKHHFWEPLGISLT